MHQPLPEHLSAGAAFRAATHDRWWPVGSRTAFIVTAVTLAVVMGGTALALGITTSHLEYPATNAILRSYFVVAPILIGLAWKLRRPESRFGLLLIGLGIATWPLSWQASNQPLGYSLGVIVGDATVVIATFYVALAYPVGRIVSSAERVVMAVISLAMAAHVVWTLGSPVVRGGGILSRCGDACPPNPLHLAGPPWLVTLAYSVETIALIVATSLLIAIFMHRLAIAPRPRRRALITVGVASLGLFLTFLAYQVTRRLLDLDAVAVETLGWTQAAMRVIFPLGFAVALVQADLFASRALQRFLERLTSRPSPHQWRDTVAAALDDPTLRIGYWDPVRSRYREADGDVLEVSADPNRTLVTVDHNGTPVAGIEVDAILRTDPELLRAAANATLLAVERGTLEGELRASQRATLAAGDQARRRIAQDLHDSAQQRLVALRIHLELARERLDQPEDREILERISMNVGEALGDIRAVARGSHVDQLHRDGLARALRTVVADANLSARLEVDGVGRLPADVEDAVYFVILEALQNVGKHGGPGAAASVTVRRVGGNLVFEVIDDGDGFDPKTAHGLGIDNMRDRTDAVGGELEIQSEPGAGTNVIGRIPLVAAGQGPTASR